MLCEWLKAQQASFHTVFKKKKSKEWGLFKTLNREELRESDLDSEAEDLNPHAAHIRSSHLSHQRGKFISVLVNLLNSKSA